MLDFGVHDDAPESESKSWRALPALHFAEQVSIAECCPQLKHVVMKINPSDSMQSLRASQLFEIPIDIVDFICADGWRVPTGQEPEAPSFHQGSAWKTVRYWDWRLVREVPNLPHPLLAQDPWAVTRRTCDYHGFEFVQKRGMFILTPAMHFQYTGTPLPGSHEHLEVFDEDDDSDENWIQDSSLSESDEEDVEPTESEDDVEGL